MDVRMARVEDVDCWAALSKDRGTVKAACPQRSSAAGLEGYLPCPALWLGVAQVYLLLRRNLFSFGVHNY
jgi:hypothetical protein